MIYPPKGDLIDLVQGLFLIQNKIQAEHGFDNMKDQKLYHLVEQVPIGWRTLKPRHPSISPSACAYCVRKRCLTSIWNSERINQLLLGRL